MSYAQRKEISGNRTMSILFTVIVVGALMYAIVTGLAYNVIKKTAEDLKTFNQNIVGVIELVGKYQP